MNYSTGTAITTSERCSGVPARTALFSIVAPEKRRASAKLGGGLPSTGLID